MKKSFLNRENFTLNCCYIFIILYLIIGIICPIFELLFKSTHNAQIVHSQSVEQFVGLKNFINYFTNKNLFSSLINSIKVALTATSITTILSFIAAFALKRAIFPAKTLFKLIFMLPLFAPTIFYGLALIYLFGRQGIITSGFFGLIPNLNLNIYGFSGIVIAEIFYIFPPCLLIMLVAFEHMDRRLYDAAHALNSSPCKTFFKVTLPGVKYGIISVIFAGFTMVFTDFGAPKVVGGNYNVMAVDIYKQVVGQQDFYMGATISIILLIPALASFFVDRYMQKRQVSMYNSKSIAYVPKPSPCRDFIMLSLCIIIATLILIMFACGIYAALVQNWPYNLNFTLKHFRMTNLNGTNPFLNSIKIASYTAFFGTSLTFLAAYLVTKVRNKNLPRKIISFISLFPL
ncbi:MAG: ABC transporter permease subunit, partial [Lentisphaeria bacterium]